MSINNYEVYGGLITEDYLVPFSNTANEDQPMHPEDPIHVNTNYYICQFLIKCAK